MMRRVVTALPVILVVLLCLAPTGCEKTENIPAMRLRVVDNATGEPQEMAMVNVMAAQEHKNPFQVDDYRYDYYLNYVYFLEAKDGWVTLPAVSFPYGSRNYTGCLIAIESPLHQVKRFRSEALVEAGAASKGAEVRLDPVEDRHVLSSGAMIYAGLGRVLDKYSQRLYEMECLEKMLQDWDRYTKGEPEYVRRAAFGAEVSGYLMRASPCFEKPCKCGPADGITSEQCMQLVQRARIFYCGLFNKYADLRSELVELRRHSALVGVEIREVGCGNP